MLEMLGKVALVTGGASGIGKAIVKQLCKKQANVIILDANFELAEKTSKQLCEEGYQCSFKYLDVSDFSLFHEVVEEIYEKYHAIDILVNNAALGMNFSDLETLEEEFINRIINTNFAGVVYGIHSVIKYMKESKNGNIINIGSINATRVRSGLNVYSACKGAVLTLTKSMALELAPHNIRVNAVNPVVTKTSMIDEEFMERTINTIPLGRIAEPEDIANSVSFLLSNEAKMITGSSLNVDGGRNL